MGLCVVVSADFSGVDSEDREKIYKCLKDRKWKKVINIGRDISTVWYASFKDEVSYSDAIKTGKDDFVECSKGFTTPRLVIHAGPNEPLIC